MSNGVKELAMTVVIAMAVVAVVVLIFIGTTNATNKVNTRLDHIGTACAKAGNTWLNDNCIPNGKPSP